MRECIFCGSAASTKEHAWPNWLIQQFPARSGAEIEGQRGTEPVLRWKSKGHSQQVRNVCAQCNNGWMSALEGEAKAIMEPLLFSSRYDLSVSARRTLTRWAMKTAMVFESLGHQRQPYYVQPDRDAIRAGESPLGNNSVWVGRCVEFNGFYSKASDLFDNPDPSSQRARGYVTTLGLGSLALQVLSVRLIHEKTAPTRITVSLADGPWSFIGEQIWPSDGGTVAWAPTQALHGEVGLEALARRFRTTPI
jgi:hypothetical protein